MAFQEREIERLKDMYHNLSAEFQAFKLKHNVAIKDVTQYRVMNVTLTQIHLLKRFYEERTNQRADEI
jgi:hypothetical protein